MRLKEFWKSESGSVAVFVALSMVILLGFTSLVVDYGYWASTRRALQNSADAVALAAASQLDGTQGALSSAQTVAETYADKNGIEVSMDPNVSMDVKFVVEDSTVNYKELCVTMSKTVDTTFSQVLTGRSTQTIRASAVASASSIFGDYDYALFGGSKIEDTDAIDISGNKNIIKGNVHSNSDISIKMNQTTITGTVTAAGTTDIPGAITGALMRDMPSLLSLVSSDEIVKLSPDEMASICGGTSPYSIDSSQFDELISYAESKAENNGQDPTDPDGIGVVIYITGDVDLHTSDSFAFPISIICSGNMVFHGSDVTSTSPICLGCGGNMTFNGGSTTFNGTLFAPNGTLTLNGTGGEVNITGSVLADVIDRNGNNLHVTYSKDAGSHLPLTKVRLMA